MASNYGLDPNVLAHELEAKATQWADLDGAASALEETRKTVLAQQALTLGKQYKSVQATEWAALASQVYRDHVASMVEARTKANRAKAQLEALRVYLDMIRTREATNRVLMQHPGR